MFQDESDFKKLVDRLDIGTEPNVSHREKLRREMLSAFSQARRPRAAKTLAGGRWQNVIQAIHKSRIAKLAAAAVIVLAALIGIHRFGWSVDGATVALGNVIESAKKMPWMHIVADWQSENTRAELWYCFDRSIEIHKQAHTIGYYDFSEHEQHVYDVDSNTITLSYFKGIHFAQDAPGAKSPWAFLERLLEKKKTEGGKVNKAKGQFQDSTVDIYEVTLPRKAHIGPTMIKIIADPKTNLPIAYHQQTVKRGRNEDEIATEEFELSFDFPAGGPSDLYAVGVPQSAMIIDNLPQPEAAEILERYQALRKPFNKQRFLCVVVWVRDEDGASDVLYRADVVYNDVELLRTDTYLTRKRYELAANWPQYKKQIGKTLESILHWLKTSEFSELRNVELFDGKYKYQHDLIPTEGWDTSKLRSSAKWNYSIMGNQLPLLRHWLSKAVSCAVVEDDYSQKNNLIGVELVLDEDYRFRPTLDKCLIYLNPTKDYHCQKITMEYQQPPDVEVDEHMAAIYVTQVADFVQTEDGQWYPKAIEDWTSVWDRDGNASPLKRSLVRTVYLETNRDFPRGIFDPENLPR
jgi:hypothetical protein